MIQMNAVCRDCELRTVGCHATCKAYIEARDAYSDAVKEINKKKYAAFDADQLKKETVQAIRKRKHVRR